MAVELAKVSLWLEALDPGKPLSFLDAHIKCGNALIGATPALIDKASPTRRSRPSRATTRSWARDSLRLGRTRRNAPGQGSLFEH